MKTTGYFERMQSESVLKGRTCNAVNGAWIAAAAGAVTSVAVADDTSRKAAHTKEDLERAKAQSEITAANNANARIQMQRKAMGDNSLATGGGSSAVGRTTLGV